MREELNDTGIILVADSGCLDSSLKEALAPTGYALLHVSNPREAIATLDLLSSEILLAVIEARFLAENGCDLIRWLERRGQRKQVKIILTTIRDRPLSAEVMKELGGHALVCKPMPPEEWRKTVDAVLR